VKISNLKSYKDHAISLIKGEIYVSSLSLDRIYSKVTFEVKESLIAFDEIYANLNQSFLLNILLIDY